jgi:hypothetical protein
MNLSLEDEPTQNLLLESMKTWGEEAQIDMFIEECAESIVEIQHYRRDRDSNMMEEFVDVYLMTRQMLTMFDQNEVAGMIAAKLTRLNKRLVKANSEPL